MNKEPAFEPNSLREMLSKRDVPTLRDTARRLELIGYSGLKKEKLIERIATAILSTERLSSLLYTSAPALWRLLLQAYSADSPSYVSNIIRDQCKVLSDLGYLQWMELESESFIFMPLEVKGVFKELLDGGFTERKERADLLDAYAVAATNLYGVISQDDFIELFNRQNEDQTDTDEVFNALLQHISADAPYSFWGEYLVHFLSEENEFKDAKHLLVISSGKPRYIPNKDVFLQFSSPDYFEETDASRKLQDFLVPFVATSGVSIEEVLSELSFSCTVDASMEHTLSVLKSYAFQMTRSQAQMAAKLIVEFSNNTRKWSNRGHTPQEIHQMFAASFSSGKRRKIGRNEMCPCGSGKKFKKCCGR